ncbi:2613_t:CDS:1, partial [Acaulospora morrowiae]
GEPEENVEVWLYQTKNILYTQGVKKDEQMVHYTTLYWFVNKVKDSVTAAFTG